MGFGRIVIFDLVKSIVIFDLVRSKIIIGCEDTCWYGFITKLWR